MKRGFFFVAIILYGIFFISLAKVNAQYDNTCSCLVNSNCANTNGAHTGQCFTGDSLACGSNGCASGELPSVDCDDYDGTFFCAGVMARVMRPNPQPLPKWEGESAPFPSGEGWGGVV